MTATRLRRTVLACALGAATAVSAGAGLAAPSGSGDSQQQTCPLPLVGADPDTVSLSGPTTLWPPNNRLVDYTLTASETAGEAGDHLPHGVTISYSVTVSGSGANAQGQANPATGSAHGDFSVPVRFQLRAERPGTGGAVTYVINWAATFDGGPHTCSSSNAGDHPFTVTVPHDRRR
jgi:hypothetical protein